MAKLSYITGNIYDRLIRSLAVLLLLTQYGVGLQAQEHTPLSSTPVPVRDTAVIMRMIRTSFDRINTQPDSATMLLNLALYHSRQLRFGDGTGMSLFGLGLLYSELNRNDTALRLYSQALAYLKPSRKYRHIVPATFSNIGYIFYFKGDYTRAVSYYDSAVRISRTMNDPDSKKYAAVTLNSIAAIQMRLNRPDRSLFYLEQVEQIAKENHLDNELAIATGNKGDVYMEMGKYDLAEQHYRQALQQYHDDKSIEACSIMATVKSGYASLKLRQGKAQEAIQLLKEVEKGNSRYRRENTAVVPALTMGAAYLQLKDYTHAENYLLKALNESIALQIQDNRDDIHKGLAEVYEATGNDKKALYHYRLYQQLKDSLLSKDKAKDIGEIDARYRTAEKDRDIARKQLQISRQQHRLDNQKLWIGGILSGVVLLGLTLLGLQLISRQKQKVQARQINILQQQKALQEQQLEINHLSDIVQGEERERVRIARELHDGIVSQLMGVRLHFQGALQYAGKRLPNKEDFENTLRHLDDATKELRKTAHNLMPETVLQGGLIMALQTFCDKMASASGINIYFQHFGLPMPRNADVELSLYRIVQELVQNAIKHAQCSQVLVELNIEDNLLSIDVEDNGCGIAEDAPEQQGGMGLKSICTRVRSLQGQITITGRTGKGTAVNMEFKL